MSEKVWTFTVASTRPEDQEFEALIVLPDDRRPRKIQVSQAGRHLLTLTGTDGDVTMTWKAASSIGLTDLMRIMQWVSCEWRWIDPKHNDFLYLIRPAWVQDGWPGQSFSGSDDRLWEEFYRTFAFRPSNTSDDWPSVDEPDPSVTYDINLRQAMTDERYRELLVDLHERFLGYFKQLLLPNERLAVLDWHHASYYLYPHCAFPWEDSSGWPTTILPNGDYYIFLEENFKFGTFGHPWEDTLCVWGTELVDLVQSDPPELLSEIKRINGKPVGNHPTN